MIQFLDDIALTVGKLKQEIEFLIPDFLPKRMITMFYADSGNGKTWLSYGVASYLCRNNLSKMVYYIDLDNPIDTLNDRKTEELLISKYDNLKYIHRSDLNCTALEALEKLASKENSRGHAYEGIVFIIDSVRNVTNMKNDEKAMYVMNLLMDIREAGATIMFIAHSNKDGKNYEGSNNMKNSSDAMFKLKKLHQVEKKSITLGLNCEKERVGTRDCEWTIDTLTLEMTRADPIYSKMNEYEEEFVQKAQSILAKNKNGLNKTQLLEAIGYKKDDITARDTLDKYTNIFFESEKKSNRYIYTLI